MKILAEGLSDPALAAMYRSLLASEARHHHGYVEQCLEMFGRDVVWPRLKALAAHEAAVLSETAPSVRLHS